MAQSLFWFSLGMDWKMSQRMQLLPSLEKEDLRSSRRLKASVSIVVFLTNNTFIWVSIMHCKLQQKLQNDQNVSCKILDEHSQLSCLSRGLSLSTKKSSLLQNILTKIYSFKVCYSIFPLIQIKLQT